MTGADPLRKQAYLELLHHGLVLLRNSAHAGLTELCRVEADHLHNLPTLLGEPNEHRHVYYVQEERGLYLERLQKLDARDYLRLVTTWYSGPWRVLASAAGIELAGVARATEPGPVAERDGQVGGP
jgi:hypothetical protein